MPKMSFELFDENADEATHRQEAAQHRRTRESWLRNPALNNPNVKNSHRQIRKTDHPCLLSIASFGIILVYRCTSVSLHLEAIDHSLRPIGHLAAKCRRTHGHDMCATSAI